MDEPTAPSPETAAITAQMCPWCDRGPFRRLASHTAPVHGVDRNELRRLGLRPAPTCLVCGGPRSRFGETCGQADCRNALAYHGWIGVVEARERGEVPKWA
jgi:hypothetical protein